jgi:adenylylsulfate kinase
VTVVASLVSPYEESRRFVRGLCRNFVEVYVSTPFAECARRDVKGLYAKAQAGAIKNFTGLDDPYEAPPAPELTLDTTHLSIADAVARVLGRLSRTTE